MLANLNASRFVKGAALVALALGGVALLLRSGLALSAPSVRWTPGTVYEEINPGVPRTVTLSFIAQDTIPATTVRVVPELQPYANVAPATIVALQKGQTVQVTLTLQAGATVPLFTAKNGTIQLRQQSNPNKTIAQPISVSLLVVPVGFPPDPGEAGKATVEGIDSNNNRVRDDLERYIALTHRDSARMRAALMQSAIALANQLTARDSEQQSVFAAGEVTKANECLNYVDSDRGLDYGEALSAQFLNTKKRIEALKKYESNLWGKLFQGVPDDERAAACEFDVGALPD